MSCFIGPSLHLRTKNDDWISDPEYQLQKRSLRSEALTNQQVVIDPLQRKPHSTAHLVDIINSISSQCRRDFPHAFQQKKRRKVILKREIKYVYQKCLNSLFYVIPGHLIGNASWTRAFIFRLMLSLRPNLFCFDERLFHHSYIRAGEWERRSEQEHSCCSTLFPHSWESSFPEVTEETFKDG